MSRSHKMIINTLVLTITAFIMRGVGIVFQAWLTKKIGAAGIGLHQLVMSVSMLASTFAISGIRFATTRLISMELGAAEHAGIENFTLGEIQGANHTSSPNASTSVGSAMRRCLLYAFCFGTAAFSLLWLGAEHIGGVWIGDTRTVLSLKILSLSLPAFSLSAVLGGYFTAVCRVAKTSAVAVFEQLVRIAVIVIALSLSAKHDLETACTIIVAGGVAGEIVSFLLLFTLFLFDRHGVPHTKTLSRRLNALQGATASNRKQTRGLTRRMLGIALPLALSAYARSALSTLQHLLVPRGLKKSGASAERALAGYGVVHGMVLPIILFPSSLFYAFAEMVVPELTDAQMRGDTGRISELVSNSLRLCLLFAVGFMACMRGFGGELGEAVYHNADAGKYHRSRVAHACDVSRQRDGRNAARTRAANVQYGVQHFRLCGIGNTRLAAAAEIRGERLYLYDCIYGAYQFRAEHKPPAQNYKNPFSAFSRDKSSAVRLRRC